MIDGWVEVLVVVTAVGCGLMAGAFFVFSVMVMPALGDLPAARGVAAMQSINVTALRPPFMAAFLGTAVASLVAAVAAALSLDEGQAGYVLAGGLLYLIGCFGETVAFHVPRNDALAEVDPDGADAPAHWRRYLREWTWGNHARTLACSAAMVVLILGLRAS
ncbi:MAG TPA: anthrone oxygenase family protein [Acidimicrobiales bacterium]